LQIPLPYLYSQTIEGLDPLGLVLMEKNVLDNPQNLADQFYWQFQKTLKIDDPLVFRFAVGELVNNCYFSHNEKLYRSLGLVDNKLSASERHQIFQQLRQTPEGKEKIKLRLLMGSIDNKINILLLSNVIPHEESLKRIEDRLSWDKQKAEYFIAQASNAYVSMTGSAGFGIYMSKREIERYGGALSFLQTFEKEWSGYLIQFPKSLLRN
jgi:hypothetical protein